MSATPPSGVPQQVQIQVDWSSAEQLPMLAANIVMVQQGQHEFILTFGAVAPPITTVPLTVEDAKKIKLKAQAVARLVLSPGRVVELIEVLRQQLNAFQQVQRH
jgi:hypothetical protein